MTRLTPEQEASIREHYSREPHHSVNLLLEEIDALRKERDDWQGTAQHARTEWSIESANLMQELLESKADNARLRAVLECYSDDEILNPGVARNKSAQALTSSTSGANFSKAMQQCCDALAYYASYAEPQRAEEALSALKAALGK